MTANNTSKPGSQKPKKKRSRALKILLIVVILLVGVIYAVPYVLSSAPGTRAVVGTINQRIPENVSIETLSLKWFRPITASGIAVTDVAGREIARVEKVTLDEGVWNSVTSPMKFGTVKLDAPAFTVYMAQAADGKSPPKDTPADDKSQQKQKQPPKDTAEKRKIPSGKKKPAPLPEVFGKVELSGGKITLVGLETSYEMTDVTGNMDLNSLNELKGDLSLKMTDGGKVSGRLSAEKLLKEGQIDLNNARVDLSLESDEPVNLQPLIRVIAPAQTIAGRANVNLQASLQDGLVNADLDAGLSELQAPTLGDRQVKPVDITMKGALQGDMKKITGNMNITGKPGNIRVDLTAGNLDEPLTFKPDDMTAALLAGGKLGLPEMTIVSDGVIDLPKLAEAVPGLLKIREDVVVEQGRVEIEQIRLVGGSAPSFMSRISLRDLATRQGDRRSRFQPLTLNVDAVHHVEKGLQVNNAEVKAEFARLSLQGGPDDMQGDLQSDLSLLNQRLHELLQLPAFTLKGKLNGTFSMKRQNEAKIEIASRFQGERLRYRQGERGVDLEDFILNYDGYITLQDNQPRLIDITDFETSVAGTPEQKDILIEGRGRYNLAGGSLASTLELQKADVKRIGAMLAALGYTGMARFGGDMTLTADLNKAGAAEPFVLNSHGAVKNARLDDRPLDPDHPDVTLNVVDVRFQPDRSRAGIKTLALDAGPARIGADGVSLTYDPEFNMTGRAQLRGDLARCTEIAGVITENKDLPRLSGQFDWQGDCRTADNIVELKGEGHIDNLTVPGEQGEFHDPRLTLNHDTSLHLKDEKLTVKTLKLDSETLKLSAAGDIAQLLGDRIVDLQGEYTPDWKKITRLMHQFAPNTRDTISMDGTATHTFRIEGPLRTADVEPAYRKLTADLTTGWDSADILGIKLKRAQLKPVLADARLTLPATEIPSEEGTVRLAGELDLQTPQNPVFRIDQNVQVIDNVQVRPEITDEMLTRFNPTFADLTTAEGALNFGLENVKLPLGKDKLKTASGTARLSIPDIRAKPTGLLGRLLSYAGKDFDQWYNLTVSAKEIQLVNGRFVYEENMIFRFGDEFDLQFAGSVGLDETVDLRLLLPAGEALLRRFGVSRSSEYGRLIADERLPVRIVGTIKQPKIQIEESDVQRLVEKAAKRYLEEQAQGALRDLFGGDKKKKDKDGKKNDPSVEERVIEGIFGILGEKKQKKNQDNNPKNQNPEK